MGLAGAFGLGSCRLFNLLRPLGGRQSFSTSTLVGRTASVSVSIPAGRNGSVLVKAEGQTHEFSATATVDIPAGTVVTVTGAAGTGLIVAPLAAAAPPPSSTDSGGSSGV